MKIDHIGYAVKNMDKARKTMELIGYVFEPMIKDLDRNILISFGEMDGYKIELVAPYGGGVADRQRHIKEWGNSISYLLYK